MRVHSLWLIVLVLMGAAASIRCGSSSTGPASSSSGGGSGSGSGGGAPSCTGTGSLTATFSGATETSSGDCWLAEAATSANGGGASLDVESSTGTGLTFDVTFLPKDSLGNVCAWATGTTLTLANNPCLSISAGYGALWGGNIATAYNGSASVAATGSITVTGYATAVGQTVSYSLSSDAAVVGKAISGSTYVLVPITGSVGAVAQ
ncbi:MAG: hypothetical protein ACLQVI_09310 [Polyangiaceae bacterium]